MADGDYRLIFDLVKVRKRRGLRQRDVAEALGVSQQAVSKIEHYDSDPRLSTIRMYATAIGAVVSHDVRMDVDQPVAVPSTTVDHRDRFTFVGFAFDSHDRSTPFLPGVYLTNGLDGRPEWARESDAERELVG
ncbi:helix-turn-helix transcriptional regulator [Rathayibacter sp. VKM Ac-2878]|nr:helix-turn-helix transcriptional regulator [Rathayibacter sp. VKM Ac-2879]MBF4504820.1 helix-turn-helix transcriptional regulator [Rathayibacter sp. VKM Ac-2878]